MFGWQLLHAAVMGGSNRVYAATDMQETAVPIVDDIMLDQPTGLATLWQTVDCVLPQLINGWLWCVAESGRTVRPWMPFGAASHGAVYLALRWGAVGWVSQQVAPSSRWPSQKIKSLFME